MSLVRLFREENARTRWLTVEGDASARGAAATPPVVISKGAKPDTVELQPETYARVHSYILAETDVKPQTCLFPKQRVKMPHPTGRRELEDMAHRWGEQAGVPDGLPHWFRHAYATGLLRGGRTSARCRSPSAHEDIKSTQVYTAIAPADRAKAVLRLPWKVGR